MAALGEGSLVGWFDCDPRAEDDVNEWLAREHFPERLGVPGFRRGRRWRSENGHPRYFIFYETEDLATLSSPPYLERLDHPTEWSRRVSPRLYGMKRTACRIVATAGDVDGGAAGTLELTPGADAGGLRAWLADGVLAAIADRPGLCAAHLLEPDPDTSTIETVEKSLRTAPDAIADWVVVIEGHHPDAIWRAVAELLAPEELRARGAAGVGDLGVYRLSFALHARG